MSEIAVPDLSSPRFKANPHPFYARLCEEAPVWRTTLPDRRTAWFVTRYEDVAGVLKDDAFAKDPLNAQDPKQRAAGPWVPGFLKPLGRNMLDLDDPDRRRLRTLVSKAFTPRLIERLRGRIEAICQGLLDAMDRKARAELVRDYALPLPATVIAELLGVPAGDHRKFHRWSNRIVSVSSDRDVWRTLPAAVAFVRYLRKMAERRRSSPEDDLISALVQAEEAGDKLSQDELLAMSFLLLVAGHETTVNLIASGTLALIEHPEQLEKLKANPQLIKPAVEELLMVHVSRRDRDRAPRPAGPRGIRHSGTPRRTRIRGTRFGQPRRAVLRQSRRSRPGPRSQQAPGIRAWRRTPLPRRAARPAGGPDRPHRAPATLSRHRSGHDLRVAALASRLVPARPRTPACGIGK
jgi:Cytochrome P450